MRRDDAALNQKTRKGSRLKEPNRAGKKDCDGWYRKAITSGGGEGTAEGRMKEACQRGILAGPKTLGELWKVSVDWRGRSGAPVF